MDLGQLEYDVVANTGDLDRAEQRMDEFSESARRGERNVEDLGDEAKRSGRRVKRATDEMHGGMDGLRNIAGRAAAIIATIGVGFSVVDAARQVADFQSAMNGLAAVSGATARQMESMEEQARTLGATSRFSAQQAAEGQRFLAQAGFEVNEVLGATPGILQLATAAELDLGTAADIASNVLGGMRLEVDQLNRVNDVLAATASRSNTTIQQLGQALSFAAPFAAGAGISIEEASAAIGTMSDAGIQASRAGTGLVGTIRQLSKVTDAGADVLARHGLSLEDVSIEARGLAPVLETLRGANLSSAEAIELFGSEAGAAAQVLVNDYSGAITDAAGEAERMAGIMEQGLTPAFRSLGSAISESVLQMGDSGLAGALEGLVRGATGVISVWNGMGEEWAEANDIGEDHLATIEIMAQSIETMAGIIIGGGGAVAAMAALTKGTKGAQAAMIALSTVIRANPIGALVTILGAAVGALFTFREELGLVAPEAEITTQRIDDLTDSINTNSKAAVEAGIVQLTSEFFQLGRAATETQARIDELTAAQQSDTRGARQNLQNMMRMEDLENRLKRINMEQEAAGQSADELRRIMEEVGQSSIQETNSLGDVSKATGDAKEETDELAQSYQSILDRLRPLQASQRQYAEEKGTLVEFALRENMAAEELSSLLADLDRAYRSTRTVAEAYGEAGVQANEDIAKAADDIGFAFKSAFEGAIIEGNGFRDVLQGILDDILKIALRTAVTEPLGQAIGSVTSGLFGGGQIQGGFTTQVSTGASFAGAFDSGGSIGSGQVGLVGERGPELVSGPAHVTGREDTARMMGGDNVEVNVYAPEGSDVRTEERQTPGGRSIDVIIDEKVAQNISNPGSKTGRALKNTFGSQRTLTGRG